VIISDAVSTMLMIGISFLIKRGFLFIF